jgi:hypothetical protein
LALGLPPEFLADGSREISPLEHLALSVNLGRVRDEPESCFMAALTAYFDDSGHHGDTKAMVIAGFVASVDQWLRFERDWNFVLRLPHIDLDYLHMKELRSGKGKFAKFKDNLELQTDLFRRLHCVIESRITTSFSSGVLLDDYDRVNKEFMVEESLGSPLLLASKMAIKKMMDWHLAKRNGEPFQVVMDEGINEWGALDEWFYTSYQFRLQPGNAKLPPLQASDHVAWEIHRSMSNVAAGKVEYFDEQRGSIQSLLRRLTKAEQTAPPTWYHVDEREMRRVFSLMVGGGPPKRVS